MSDRATAVWRRFSGMFGSEALARKFGDTPPEEWSISIARLKDYELERGMKRLVFSGKSYIPSLPEFLRLCKEVASDQFPDEQRQPFPPSHQIAGPRAQPWEAEANNHLLVYVWQNAYKHRKFTPEETRILVEHKNFWAQEMREADKPSEDGGKSLWVYRMNAAEQQMAQQAAA